MATIITCDICGVTIDKKQHVSVTVDFSSWPHNAPHVQRNMHADLCTDHFNEFAVALDVAAVAMGRKPRG